MRCSDGGLVQTPERGGKGCGCSRVRPCEHL
uniref:Uncharacterized protein n=1 Tax=Anopheles minimus TaxID=112268 RepID=A0A182WPZ4_9DIPT